MSLGARAHTSNGARQTSPLSAHPIEYEICPASNGNKYLKVFVRHYDGDGQPFRFLKELRRCIVSAREVTELQARFPAYTFAISALAQILKSSRLDVRNISAVQWQRHGHIEWIEIPFLEAPLPEV